MTKAKKEPLSGDITVRRKEDKVQLVRTPKVVLASLTAEEALALSGRLADECSKLLQSTDEE